VEERSTPIGDARLPSAALFAPVPYGARVSDEQLQGALEHPRHRSPVLDAVVGHEPGELAAVPACDLIDRCGGSICQLARAVARSVGGSFIEDCRLGPSVAAEIAQVGAGSSKCVHP